MIYKKNYDLDKTDCRPDYFKIIEIFSNNLILDKKDSL